MGKKILSGLFHFVAVLAGVAFSVLVSYLLYIWSDYPAGNDSVSHLFRIKVITEFWPDINWIHTWAAGMPLFQNYPIAPYLLMAVVFKNLHLSMELILSAYGVACVVFTGLGIYLLVHEVSKNKLISLASFLVYLVTPASWSYAFSGGLYSRASALPFMVFSIWVFFKYLRAESDRAKRLSHFFSAILLALTVFHHQLVGFIAFLICGFLGLVVGKDTLYKRFINILKVFVPAALLTSAFSIPFFAAGQSTETVGNPVHVAAPPSLWDFIIPLDRTRQVGRLFLNQPGPFLLTVPLLLWIYILVQRNKPKATMKLAWFFTFITALFSFYAFFQIPALMRIYVILGVSWGIIGYLSIFCSILIGLLLSLINSRLVKNLLAVVLMFLVILWAKFQLLDVLTVPEVPRVKQASVDVPLFIRDELTNPRRFNFRLATENAGIGSAFNYIFPYIPQARDYYWHGVIDKNQRFYLFYTLWHIDDRLNEVDYLCDWWAVRELITDPEAEYKDKFLQSDSFEFVGSEGLLDLYRFKYPSPILEASKTPSVLVVGNQNDSNVFFRSLSFANFNSRYFIPVYLSRPFSDLTFDELKAFPVVFLYDYEFQNPKREGELVKKYIEAGGNLFIEANRAPEEGDILNEILPVAGIDQKEAYEQWGLEKEEGEGGLLAEINLTNFGPPVYDNGPWKVGVGRQVKQGAEVLITLDKEPVLASWTKYKGRVIWSGLNLPFHVLNFQNGEESKLLGILLTFLAKGSSVVQESKLVEPISDTNLVYDTHDYKVTFINPQKRTVEVKTQSQGILFKEFYYPGWIAYKLSDGKKENLPIYKAGPNFMYIPGGVSGDKVVLEFRTTLVIKIASVISILTFIFLLAKLFGLKLFSVLSAKVESIVGRATSNIKEKWEEDEV